jgi:hypothetical protein
VVRPAEACELEPLLKALAEQIYGNGKLGLKTEVELVKQRIELMEKFYWIVVSASVATFFTSATSLVALLAAHFLKLKP